MGPPDTTGFQPEVGADITAAWERVLASPADAGASGDLAMRFHAYGSFADAARWYERTRRLDRDDFRWAYYEALVLARDGRNEEALQRFDEALTINPDHLGARLKRALTEAQLGRTEAATASLAGLAESHRDNALLLFELGRLQLAKGDARSAVRTLERALYVGGDFADGHAQLAAAYSQLGDDDAAAREDDLVPFVGPDAVEAPVDGEPLVLGPGGPDAKLEIAGHRA